MLVPYIALAPTIVAGGLTLGVLTQTTRAFGRVEESFQYLVRSWTTIVSLLSIYKRLRAFEATLRDEPLDTIEAEPIRPGRAGGVAYRAEGRGLRTGAHDPSVAL